MYTMKDLELLSNLQEIQEHMEAVYNIYRVAINDSQADEINEYLQLNLEEWLKITNDLLKVALFHENELPIDDVKEIVTSGFSNSKKNPDDVEKAVKEKQHNLATEYENLTNGDFLGYVKSMIYRGF